MKVKVCGMKYPENMEEVARLAPDYLGFIFWEPSPRYFSGSLPELPEHIRKVGVFVDASIDDILEKARDLSLDLIQLHGKESPEFCSSLRTGLDAIEKPGRTEIIKAIAIGGTFSFDNLIPYEGKVDYFLFDSKGPMPGGNGFVFDWKLLQGYNQGTSYFLSGGIGLDQVEELGNFLGTPLAQKCHAIDVNSAFEMEAGLKDPHLLSTFIKEIKH